MRKQTGCKSCGAMKKRQLVMFLGDNETALFDEVITKQQRESLFLFLERELNLIDLSREDNPLLKAPTQEQRWQQIGDTLASIIEDETLPEPLRARLADSIGEVVNDLSSGADTLEVVRHDFVQACQHAQATERSSTDA